MLSLDCIFVCSVPGLADLTKPFEKYFASMIETRSGAKS